MIRQKWTLEKEFTFEASHQLAHHDGKCARLHGHSWKGKVIIQGSEVIAIGPKTNMLYDYADLKKAIAVFLDEKLDHHHLNETLEEESPTSEFVAAWVWKQLDTVLPKVFRLAVVIDETCTSRCTYERAREEN